MRIFCAVINKTVKFGLLFSVNDCEIHAGAENTLRIARVAPNIHRTRGFFVTAFTFTATNWCIRSKNRKISID